MTIDRLKWLEDVERAYLDCCAIANVMSEADTVAGALGDLYGRMKAAEVRADQWNWVEGKKI